MSENEFVPVMSARARKTFDQNGINHNVDLLNLLDQRIKSLSHQFTQNVTANTLESIISNCKQLYSLTFNDIPSVSEIESKITDVKLLISKAKSNKKHNADINKNEAIEYVKYLEEELKTANALMNYRDQTSKLKLKAEQLLQQITNTKNTNDSKPYYNSNNSNNLKTLPTNRSTPTARKPAEKNCIIKVKIPKIVGIALSSKYWHMLKDIQNQANVYITVNNNISENNNTQNNNVSADGMYSDYSIITIKGNNDNEVTAGQNGLNELMKSMVIKNVPDITDSSCEEVFNNIKNMTGPKVTGCLVMLNGMLHVVGTKDVVEKTLDKISELLSEKETQKWIIDVFSDDKFWELALQSKQLKRFNCRYSSGTISIVSNILVYKSLKKEIDLILSNECCKYVEIERYQANKMLNNGAEMIKYFQKKGATCVIGQDRMNMIVYGSNEAVEEYLKHVESLKKNSVKVGISSLRIPIDPEHSKLIIGKGGGNIKKLIEKSGVETIQVDRSEFPSVSISGANEAVEKCKRLILEIITPSNTPSEKSINQPIATPNPTPNPTVITPVVDPPDIGPDSFPSLTDNTNLNTLPVVKGSWAKPIKPDE